MKGEVTASSSRQCARLFRLVHEEIFSEVQYLSVRPPTLVSGSCDFYLFAKVKSTLKGTRFESVEAVKEKAVRLLSELTDGILTVINKYIYQHY